VSRSAIAEEIRQARDGDKEALGLCLLRMTPNMRYWASRYTNHIHDIDDIVQAAATNVTRKIGDVTCEGSFPAWVRQIVRNEALTMLRSQKLRRENIILETDIGTNDDDPKAFAAHSKSKEARELAPWEESHRKDVAQQIEDVLRILPKGCSDILRMFYVQEMKVSEIAEHLGIEKNTLKTRLFRARQLFQVHWRDRFGYNL